MTRGSGRCFSPLPSKRAGLEGTGLECAGLEVLHPTRLPPGTDGSKNVAATGALVLTGGLQGATGRAVNHLLVAGGTAFAALVECLGLEGRHRGVTVAPATRFGKPNNVKRCENFAPTLRRCAGRCPPRGLNPLGAARRGFVTPTLRRCAGRCPPRGLNPLGAALRGFVTPTLHRCAGRCRFMRESCPRSWGAAAACRAGEPGWGSRYANRSVGSGNPDNPVRSPRRYRPS